jgi:phage terminase large subunit
MPELDLPAHGWLPRDYQQPAWDAMEKGCLRHALAWHRRAGKDDFALARTAVGAFERVGPYWHLLPQANQARKAIWDAVNPRTGRRRIDDHFPRELRESTRENDMFIRFKNGSTWQVVGSDNYDALVGAPPVGVVFSEYALSDPAAWSFIRPILAENGGWAMFISSVRGRNHFWRLVEYARKNPGEWFGQVLSVRDTGAIPMETIDRERREMAAERGDKEAQAVVDQEYFSDPDAALPGAYYGEHMTNAQNEGRIGDFPWLPNLPVGIASDLGSSDQTVNWFYQQPPGGRVRIINVLPGSGVGVDWYAKRINALPYTIADTIWPHDGAQNNIRDVNNTGLVKLAGSFGWSPIRCLPNESIESGIAAARIMFPLVEFNENPLPFLKSDGAMETMSEARQRMARALDALRQYRREYDEKRQCFKDSPLHDWTSDFADAFRYLAKGRKPFIAQASMQAVQAVGASDPLFG